MTSLNKVILIGHLGKDPEMRTMPNGDAVANFSLATSKSWQNKTTGEKVTQTEWHRIVFYRRLAEIAGQYLAKGSLVYIEGEIQSRKWTDQNGQERQITEIIGSTLQMLGKAEGGQTQGQGQAQGQNQRQPQRQTPPPSDRDMMTSAEQADLDDDIPF